MGVGILEFYRFTSRSSYLTPFGDPLSVLTERGERATKGLQSRPLETAFNAGQDSDVLCAYRLATVHLTRLSRLRRSAYPLASACCMVPQNIKSPAVISAGLFSIRRKATPSLSQRLNFTRGSKFHTAQQYFTRKANFTFRACVEPLPMLPMDTFAWRRTHWISGADRSWTGPGSVP